jgi:hypothetical protein
MKAEVHPDAALFVRPLCDVMTPAESVDLRKSELRRSDTLARAPPTATAMVPRIRPNTRPL